jgi:hypothetical protein
LILEILIQLLALSAESWEPMSKSLAKRTAKSVTAQIAFLNDEWKGNAELARIYSRETRHANTSKQTIDISDARPLQAAGEFELDRNGFTLIQHATQFDKFDDKQAIEKDYFEEMRQVILELTGADDAMPFPFYQLRSRKPVHFFDAYSLYMHCDFSLNTWQGMAQNIIKKHGDGRQYAPEEYDFALYNLWRPIHHAAQRDPLTLVDASTIDEDDIIEYRLTPDGEASLAALPVYNPSQKFYYFPMMQTDEVLIFKQQDSRDGFAKVCPHTSFVDPSADHDAPERHSIDIRMICVYKKT